MRQKALKEIHFSGLAIKLTRAHLKCLSVLFHASKSYDWACITHEMEH